MTLVRRGLLLQRGLTRRRSEHCRLRAPLRVSRCLALTFVAFAVVSHPRLQAFSALPAVHRRGGGSVCRPLGPLRPRLAGRRRCVRSPVVDRRASRRDVLLGGGAALSSDGAGSPPRPVCEMPLHRLQPSPGQVGGRFASVSALIKGEKAELMLDSGLTTGMVTPASARKLNLRRVGSAEGEAAGGTSKIELVEVPDLALECGQKVAPLDAVVSDFPQESVDRGLPLDGMLGYQALQDFDVDVDFPRAVLRLWRPGEGVAAARAAGLSEVAGVVLPQVGILGVRIMAPGGAGRAAALGIVDTGAAFSAVSASAAPALGAKAVPGGPEVAAMGVDGRPLRLPLARDVALPLGGAPLSGGGWATAVTLSAEMVAVGDLPALAAVAGDRRKPAVLLGLDVLAHKRLVFAAANSGDGGLTRQLFIG
mmetsp:Transcript_48767/g.98316  ORF Transcript_48767/g.98316 Transcript_48767/m.98316 type:complete len:422 (-) Transcript_48767:30-1295(-)